MSTVERLMVDTALTPRQEVVLETLREMTGEKGYPPTRAELGDALQINPNGVQDHLKVLKTKGYIALIPAISRGIRILK